MLKSVLKKGAVRKGSPFFFKKKRAKRADGDVSPETVLENN